MAQAAQAYNVGAMTRRILAWYDRADDAQRTEGTTWYGDARTFCAQLAAQSPYTFEQVAHVVAALSPQVKWGPNMAATIAAVDAHRTAPDTLAAGELDGYVGYRANVVKAGRILDGDLSALRGPKVEAFAAAIMGDLSHVVVDVWATRAARGQRDNDARAYADDEMPGAREHRAIAEAYRRAAKLRGVEPAVMQAVAWVTVRSSEAWQRPQAMTDAQARRRWQRQARARAALGLAMPYTWQPGMAKRKRSILQATLATA